VLMCRYKKLLTRAVVKVLHDV